MSLRGRHLYDLPSKSHASAGVARSNPLFDIPFPFNRRLLRPAPQVSQRHKSLVRLWFIQPSGEC